MYLSSARARDAGLDRSVKGRGMRVPGNVVALGSVSLITDISSEMITAVLPVYLVFGLGVSLVSVGIVDGLYAGVTVLVSLLAAHVADRTQRRKAVAAVGYGLSAVSKLGLPAVGASLGGIAAVIGVDRTGKGLRTAPRDALISLSSPPDLLGRSFGVHRAMDTAGALAGPIVAFFVLRAAPGAYDAVFVVSFCIAAMGLLVLLAFVRDRRDRIAAGVDVSLRAGLALLRQREFRTTTVQATLLATVTLSDAFVYLLLQHRLDVPLVWFPLLPLGTASVYMVLAAPVGRLADSWGRRRVFVAGNAAMLAVYVVLLAPLPAAAVLLLALALHGVY
jgi:MFS family permease